MITETFHPDLETLKSAAAATMPYGSYARGDQSSDSDIDILQIVNKAKPSHKVGSMVISFYTSRQLSKLAKQGSLFVLHLRTEGIILDDPQGILSSALDCYLAPSDYSGLRRIISVSAAVLYLKSDSLNPQQVSGIVSLGLYLLRTLIYVRCIEKGEPTFRLTDAKQVLGDDRALALLAERRKLLEKPTPLHIAEILSSVETLLGCTIGSLGSELEAVAVNAARINKQAGQLVTRILLGDANVHYEALIEDDL